MVSVSGLRLAIVLALNIGSGSQLTGGVSDALVPIVTRASAAQDSAQILVAIYTPVLDRALHRDPARAGLPILLDVTASNAGCAPHCVDTVLVRHQLPADVIERLKSAGLIQSTCSPPGHLVYGCPGGPPHVYVRMGLPFRLRPGFRVKPVEETAGSTYEQAAARLPDAAAVEVQVALDLLVDAPCPAAPGSERCRFPDVTTFRYFLREEADGRFRVVTSMTTGGI